MRRDGMSCTSVERTNLSHQNTMQLRFLTSVLAAVTCGLLALTTVAQAQDKKADPTGTWTWSRPGRDGGPARVSTLKLKSEGDKLTGTLNAPGFRGGEATTATIKDGQIKGHE